MAEELQKVLTEDSEARAAASKDGLLRPFLLIVSMPATERVTFGKLLGIDLTREQGVMGNAHAEALCLLNKNKKGLTSLANTGMSSLAGFNTPWIPILLRVLKHRKVDVGDLKNLDPVNHTLPGAAKKKAYADSIEKGNLSSAEELKTLEEHLMRFILTSQQGFLTPEQQENVTKLLERPEVQDMESKLAPKGLQFMAPYIITLIYLTSGISPEDMESLEEALADTDINAKSDEASKAKKKESMKALGTKIVTNVAPVQILNVVCPPLGMAYLAKNVSCAVGSGVFGLGTNVKALCDPVEMLMTHRLMLLLNGVDIDQFH